VDERHIQTVIINVDLRGICIIFDEKGLHTNLAAGSTKDDIPFPLFRLKILGRARRRG